MTMIEEEAAIIWAQQRKRADETVMVSTCPCCKTNLAIYIKQIATMQVIPPAPIPIE